MKILVSASFAVAMMSGAWSSMAIASGSHSGGHYDFGEPGTADQVTQTVSIKMVDANGELAFVHEPLKIKRGDVVRFVLTNDGELPHEFSVGDAPSQRAHALMMQKMPEMKHENDATVVTVEPNETKELIWNFNKPIKGAIEFACHVPGHYEAGMVSRVQLSK